MTHPHRPLISAGLVLCLLCSVLSVGADDKPLSDKYPPHVKTDAQKRDFDLFRSYGVTDPAQKQKMLDAYPFVSLEERLKFDGPGRKRVNRALPAADLELARWGLDYWNNRAKIPPAPLAMLTIEDHLKNEEYFQRSVALAELHKLEVRKFVTNPGFGRARLVRRSTSAENDPPPRDWSEGDRGADVTLPETGGFFAASRDKKGPTLPSVVALRQFHSETTYEFSRPDSWGLVRDKKQVAGFKPHTLEGTPDAYARKRHDEKNPTKDKDGRITGYPVVERWAVRKVELIGLLMHDSPVVYLNSENRLPTMADVKDAQTRAPIEFESNALKDLAAGKEAVFVAATTNQVRMVGAIRMAEACTKCHDGKQGDLLGAFTYDLVRVPAFVPAEK
jgi:hypothetical protein